MKVFRKTLSEVSTEKIEEIYQFLNINFCTIFHEVDFNRVVSDVFHTEFSYNLVYGDDGKLIALCPLHSIRDGLLTKTYSNPAMYDIPYGGWIYDRKEVSLHDLVSQLKISLKESLTYWSVPQIETNDYDFLKHKLAFETVIIDLTLSLDDILNHHISRKRRETIRSASRKGVVVEKLDPSHLDLFIEQCDYLRTSVGLKSLPADYFVKLFEFYHSKAKIAAFASKLDDHYLASGVIIGNTRIVHLWIAGKPKETTMNVPRQDLLVWEAIKWAKEIGSRYFDLCVVEQSRLPNAAKFKLGFSKKIVPFYCVTKRNLGYRIISKLRRCF